jgi:hypothetical protein
LNLQADSIKNFHYWSALIHAKHDIPIMDHSWSNNFDEGGSNATFKNCCLQNRLNDTRESIE